MGPPRELRCLGIASAALAGAVACGPSRPPSDPPPPVAVTIEAPRPAAPVGSPAPAGVSDEPRFVVTETGELTLPGPVTFRVRPVAGPGTMGPSELSPESDAALSHVAAYMRAHPTARVRIECAVSAFKTSSGPNAGRGAYFANLAARWLVDRGVACERLEAAGVVERGVDAPAESVRIFVRPAVADASGARSDPCRAP